MVAFYIYWHVESHSKMLDRLASKYIYYGILARLFPCLKKTRERRTEGPPAPLKTVETDWKSTPLISNEH